MQLQQWLNALPHYLILFPAAASCYLPMKNQLRLSRGRTAALCLAVLAVFSLAAAWAEAAWRLETNDMLLPALLVFFPLYRRTVRADLARTMAVYAGVCAVETFPTQLANALEAHLYPETWEYAFSLEASLFQLAVSLLMLAAASCIRRQIVWVIDQLDFPRVWYATVPLSCVFLVFNIAIVPETPDMYYAIRPYYLFPMLECCALALLVGAYVMFYQEARLLWERGRVEQRTQLLEMQSHQYRALREHMRQTARLRHDFRHTVRALLALAEQGDLEGIRSYLARYEHTVAESESVSFCANATLNALFGYYHDAAVSAGVETDWRIGLPEPLTVPELDLINLFGNLMENGLDGCQTLPEGKRYFSLTAEIRQGNSLYIVSTNSFDGRVRRTGTGYRSTKYGGNGIGLASISALAEKHGGAARFSNSGTEFFADVVMKI